MGRASLLHQLDQVQADGGESHQQHQVRQLKPLRLSPAMHGTARFGLVTLNRRAQAPGLAIVSRVMDQVLRD
jgi:hypothetical protein